MLHKFAGPLVGGSFCGAPVRPNMLNMPKSASAQSMCSHFSDFWHNMSAVKFSSKINNITNTRKLPVFACDNNAPVYLNHTIKQFHVRFVSLLQPLDELVIYDDL